MTIQVQTPTGGRWRVRRHVLPWRPVPRGDLIGAGDPVELLLSFAITLVLWPVELVLVVLLAIFVLPLRLLGLMGWRVTAVRRGGHQKLTRRVRGWQAAGAKAERRWR